MKFTDHVGVVRSVINAVNSGNPFPVVKHIRLTRVEMDELVHSSFMQYVYDSHPDMISRVSVDGYIGQSVESALKKGTVNSFVLRGIIIDVENID